MCFSNFCSFCRLVFPHTTVVQSRNCLESVGGRWAQVSNGMVSGIYKKIYLLPLKVLYYYFGSASLSLCILNVNSNFFVYYVKRDKIFYKYTLCHNLSNQMFTQHQQLLQCVRQRTNDLQMMFHPGNQKLKVVLSLESRAAVKKVLSQYYGATSSSPGSQPMATCPRCHISHVCQLIMRVIIR